ncbi:Uncharacterised protein [Citrobacter koseri]|uniref:Uncharacterized protein n=1 Tax=Citrobacter koseri TaxID=545 RepID=A0A2X2VZM2_CITKO|nr:Uncharacterised protein [Citrobacter koseri]
MPVSAVVLLLNLPSYLMFWRSLMRMPTNLIMQLITFSA